MKRLQDASCAICMDSLFDLRDDLDEVLPIATPDCGESGEACSRQRASERWPFVIPSRVFVVFPPSVLGSSWSLRLTRSYFVSAHASSSSVGEDYPVELRYPGLPSFCARFHDIIPGCLAFLARSQLTPRPRLPRTLPTRVVPVPSRPISRPRARVSRRAAHAGRCACRVSAMPHRVLRRPGDWQAGNPSIVHQLGRGGGAEFSSELRSRGFTRQLCPNSRNWLAHAGATTSAMVADSQIAGSSPLRPTQKSWKRPADQELLNLARRARNISAEVDSYTAESAEGDIAGTLRRAESLRADAVETRAAKGFKVSLVLPHHILRRELASRYTPICQLTPVIHWRPNTSA